MEFKDIKYDIPVCHEGHKCHEGHEDTSAYLHFSEWVEFKITGDLQTLKKYKNKINKCKYANSNTQTQKNDQEVELIRMQETEGTQTTIWPPSPLFQNRSQQGPVKAMKQIGWQSRYQSFHTQEKILWNINSPQTCQSLVLRNSPSQV